MASTMPSGAGTAALPKRHHYKYEVQKGYFLQSEEQTNNHEVDLKAQNLGLILRTYPTEDTTIPSPSSSPGAQWTRFMQHVQSLNRASAPYESYKLLLLTRHGQGWHNVAESEYGTEAWDAHYSLLPGIPPQIWADAHLTPLGRAQALSLRELWLDRNRGLPWPDAHFVSPLSRAIQTADLIFAGHTHEDEGEDKSRGAYKPLIAERARETLGQHTCDARLPRASLSLAFPHVRFEDGFAEDDALWDAVHRETRVEVEERVSGFLDGVFESAGEVVSVTSHSGAIRGMLGVLGHREVGVPTGGLVPVFVKGVRVEG